MMCRKTINYLICSFFFFICLACYQLKAENILIFSASSLALPLSEIVDLYEKKSVAKINISFASSSILAQQISRGAPADIFISANEKWMNFLARNFHVIYNSKRKILSNQLVIISRSKSKKASKKLSESWVRRMIHSSHIAIGDPDHVPAGIYAKQALTRLEVWNIVRNKLARVTNARAVLNLVERGETMTGIVYKTDALGSRNVNVMYNFPE